MFKKTFDWIFLCLGLEDAPKLYSNRFEMVQELSSILKNYGEVVREITDMIPAKNGDHGGFFKDINEYTDILTDNNRLRIGIINKGKTLDRYILLPKEIDLSDEYLDDLCDGIAGRMPQGCDYIVYRDERVRYIHEVLSDRGIFVDKRWTLPIMEEKIETAYVGELQKKGGYTRWLQSLFISGD